MPIPPPGLTIGPLTFTPRELLDPPANSAANYSGPNHVLQVTISNLTATFSSTDFSSPPPSLTIAYSYSPEFSNWTDDTADITITYDAPASSPLAGFGTAAETYRQVSLSPTLNKKPNPNYVLNRINGVSSLVTVAINKSGLPLQSSGGAQQFPPTLSQLPWTRFASTKAPVLFQANDFISLFQQDRPLDKLPIFNLLVIPGVTDNLLGSVLTYATAFCERRRAFLIMDPPLDDSADGTIPPYTTLIEDNRRGQQHPGRIGPAQPELCALFPLSDHQ